MFPKTATMHYNGTPIFNNHSKGSLTKVCKSNLIKGALTNDHSNSSTSLSRLPTNVTITEKQKPTLLSKVVVFIRNRTNKQLWQKVTIPFWLQKYNILWASQIQQSVESSTRWSNKIDHFPWKILQKLQIDWTLFLRKHSGVVSNLEHIPYKQQNENKNAYDYKTNENLNEQQIKVF
jgi:hypothetical protein